MLDVTGSIVVLGTCFLCSGAPGDVIHVPADAPTIQAGIDLATGGDEVVVAEGVYTGAGNRDLDFHGKLITVRSAGGPAVCVIDCESAGRAFLFENGETDGSRVEGFTIRDGQAESGGAIYIDDADPTIVGCVFEENTADRGGAVYNIIGHPTIDRCSFISNSAPAVDGGAIYNLWGGASLTNCLFDGNSAGQMGGAMFGDFAIVELVNCTMSRNTAQSGGGIRNYAGVELTLSNCILWENEDSSGTGFGAQIASVSSSVVIENSCVAGLTDGVNVEASIGADPLFVDPIAGDYRLLTGSPCIDAGLNTALPSTITFDLVGSPRFVDDPDAPDCPQAPGHCGLPPIVDMGAYEHQVCPADFDADGQVGFPDLLAVISAWGPCPDCPEDLDGSGDVGFGDLLVVLASWGPCPD